MTASEKAFQVLTFGRLSNMVPFVLRSILGLVMCLMTLGTGVLDARATEGKEIPVKGSVTLVELGSNACIPCKMMAPILEKLGKSYKGKAEIVTVDVYKEKEQVKRFGIRAIPTLIFFDAGGKEVHRHVGFMAEQAIVEQLKKMGVN